MPKKKVYLRILPSSRLSFPTLLNVWEKNGIDEKFEVKVLTGLDKPQSEDVILYSFLTPFLPQVHREILELKTTRALIAGGGPHISADQDLARDMGFDTLFIGPGEKTFLDFGLDLIQGNKIKPEYRHNPENDLLFRDYQPVSKYLPTVPPLEITRGCFWKCRYCETRNLSVHYRDLDSVEEYFKLAKKKQLRRINFISPSGMEFQAGSPGKTVLNKIKELLQLAASYKFTFIEYGIFPSELRPDTVTEQAMDLLKNNVSNRAVTIGAQSGSDARLKELLRGHSSKVIEQAINIANRHGFLVNLDFIMGYPDETPRERRETLLFIKGLVKKYRIKLQLHYFFPLPGSDYAYRLPSFAAEKELNGIRQLFNHGLAGNSWLDNLTQLNHYLSWLKTFCPKIYKKYC